MSAVLDAARTGYQVTIVEKTDKLGGWAEQTPTALPFEAMENPDCCGSH